MKYYNMDKLWKHYAKWNKSVTKDIVGSPLYEMSRIGKYVEQKLDQWLSRDGEKGIGLMVLSTRFLFEVMKIFLNSFMGWLAQLYKYTQTTELSTLKEFNGK